MTANQISVFVENKSGALAQITKELSDAGVNLRALSIAETHDFGVLRFIADKEDTAVDVLRQAGHVLSVTPVLAVILKDEPGTFSKAVEALAAANIDVEYVYAFLTPKLGTACMIFRVEDNDTAEKVLRGTGFTLASQEDLI